MKHFNTTDAAAFLGISRQTMYRLADNDLPPDELSPAGKKLWYYQTLVKIKYAGSRKGLAAQFTADSFPGVSCSAEGAAALQGVQVKNSFIGGSSFVSALAEVMTALSALKPNLVILPQRSLKDDFGKSVISACLASGIGIYIEPGQKTDQ
jgi:hypothetical protein